jgi:hypothetical protein
MIYDFRFTIFPVHIRKIAAACGLAMMDRGAFDRAQSEKTKPIESQPIVSPQIYLAVEKQFEKTKPI